MTGLPPIERYPLPGKVDLPANKAVWDIQPEKAALLIHDMQRYFLAPFHASMRESLIQNCKAVRSWCEERNVPVVFTAQPGDMTPEERGLLKDIWGPGMKADPVDRTIVGELSPQPHNYLLTKWRYSAFQRSNLLELLREQGREQLIICGVYGHVGILATAIEAFSNDIQPFIVADAVGDFSEHYHKMTIEYSASRCAFVTTTEEFL